MSIRELLACSQGKTKPLRYPDERILVDWEAALNERADRRVPGRYWGVTLRRDGSAKILPPRRVAETRFSCLEALRELSSPVIPFP